MLAYGMTSDARATPASPPATALLLACAGSCFLRRAASSAVVCGRGASLALLRRRLGRPSAGSPARVAATGTARAAKAQSTSRRVDIDAPATPLELRGCQDGAFFT